MEEQGKARPIAGSDKKVRIEGWFTSNQRSWLHTLAKKEDRSISSVLRQAVNLYIKRAIEEQAARERAYQARG